MHLRPRVLLLGALLATTACDDERALVTRLFSEPPGEHCPNGGAALATGVDNDGDGELDTFEIDTVEYQCSAAPPAVLVREDVEPPGANCPGGGRAVRVGQDIDGNGRLDDAEVEQTSYVCEPHAIWDGDLTITVGGDGDDQAQYRDLRVVTGSLTFVGVGDVHLPELELVVHDLRVGASASLDLPALHTVGGELGLGTLATCALPRLARVGGSVDLGIGLRLAAFDAPALAVVDGDLTVIANSALTALRLPALTRVGGDLVLRSASALETVALDALASVGGAVAIRFVAELTAVDGLDALAAVGAGVEIELNDRLARVELPALHALAGDLRISGNDALRAIDLRALALAPGAVWLTGEALATVDLRQLGQAAALEIRGHVGGFGAPAPGTLTAVDVGALQQVGDLALRGFATQLELVLPLLRRIEGQLFLEGLGALETVRLPALTDASVLRLSHGANLRALQLGVAGEVRGVQLLSLADLDLTLATDVVLPREVAGTTWLIGCTVVDLALLGNLERTARLRLDHTAGFVDLRGLAPTLEVATLDLSGNPDLAALAGLETLDHLAGDLVIWGNPLLVDVAGLGNLAVVGGDVSVTRNDVLPDLDGLGLRAVGGDLQIAANDQLGSLAGLAALTHVGGAVTVSGRVLPASEIAALRARLSQP